MSDGALQIGSTMLTVVPDVSLMPCFAVMPRLIGCRREF
jgi:hypothetical protein